MAGAHERERFALARDALDHDLHLAAARLGTVEARLDDARVVQDDGVFRPDKGREVREAQVLDAARCRVEMEQAARGALGRGVLRDEVRGQRVVEVRDLHRQQL
jgi:hypothetical protein